MAGEVPEYGNIREIGFYVLTPTMFRGRESAVLQEIQLA
jgi:hypothetical protein